jgi:hypothetical protein
VQAQLDFRLADGEILVGGISRQTVDAGGLVPATEFVRPVVGGTGAYAGAGGTLTTTLTGGTTYQEHFALTGLGARTTQTVRLMATAAGQHAQTTDQPPAGASAGDQNTFSGPLRDPRGKRRIGTVRGLQTTVSVEDGLQTVASQLTYALSGRGTLVVGGLSRYPAAGATGTVKGTLPARPVLGGTGEFAGAHGVMRAVRSPDGGYRLTFSLAGAPSRKR